MPIYKVMIAGQPHGRLVKADNKAQALNFVARGAITTELASQDTLFDLAAAGVKLEDATEPQAQIQV